MKNIIITGASRGIGKALMCAFAKKGYNIWACMRKVSPEQEAEIKELEQLNNIWIKPIILELQDAESIKRAVKEIFSSKEKIDCLINNAGISGSNLFLMTPIEQLKEIFEVDFFGLVQFSQLIAKKMVRQKDGNIINMASVRGLKAEKGNLAYGTAKASVIYATKVMALELGQYNIRVNAVAPGLIPTEIIAYKSDELIKDIVEDTALKKSGDVEDVISMIQFLCSDDAKYITGQIMSVDGGYSI